MAELIYSVSKDPAPPIILKNSKKPSSSLGRMLLFLFSMICGVYIVLSCLKQLHSNSTAFNVVRIIDKPCPNSDPTKQRTPPLLHFPNPKTFKRSECLNNPVRLFSIVSMQRSGSGWFETLLNSHPNLSSNGEIFNKERRANISIIMHTLDKVYNLDWLSSASKNECSAAVGFKWMLNQGLLQHHEAIVDYFNRRGVTAIFLFRKNTLRRMISLLANNYDSSAKLLNGTHKSHVHSDEEANTLSKYKPIINTTTVLRELRGVDRKVRNALCYFNSTRHIALYYEDVVKNRTKLREVQEFLGLPVKELSSRQVKIHKGPLSDLVENWDELSASLNGTAYQTFIQDPDY